MRECVLLALAGCLITTEGPVVVSTGEILDLAVDDLGVVWAEQTPGQPVNVWAFERGALRYKVHTVEALHGLALVRHVVYWSSGADTEIVGSSGRFIVTRTGDRIDAFDPAFDALDHDPWQHTYPAAGATGVGLDRLAIGTGPFALTFELGSAHSDVHDLGAHAPTLVRPIAGGIAFADHEGLFTTRHGRVERIAEAADWAHLVELEGVLWAATAAGAEPARLLRVEDGVATEVEPAGVVTALTTGAGHVYYATDHAIYRLDRAAP